MTACLLCKCATRLILDLGETPLANELNDTGRYEKFPLRLVQCTRCKHLQIDHHVSPERLYRDSYVYVSNTSQANRDHFAGYARAMEARFKPSFVVDVGGNDGLFASHFGCKKLVVDPASKVCAVPAFPELFTEGVGGDIAREAGKADLITCNNCFAHNADLVPILKGVKALLAEKGTFVFEVAYALPMLQKGLFDLIYHEHVHHWTLQAASTFLREHGLLVYDAELVPTHGGSIRIYAKHLVRGRAPKSATLPVILENEFLYLDEAVIQFPHIVEQERSAARRTISGFRTVGLLGYPAKACTLLSYWGCGNDVQHVYDDNPHKIGKRTHFGHVIESTSEVPHGGSLLVASWNYADELRTRFRAPILFIPHPFRCVG